MRCRSAHRPNSYSDLSGLRFSNHLELMSSRYHHQKKQLIWSSTVEKCPADASIFLVSPAFGWTGLQPVRANRRLMSPRFSGLLAASRCNRHTRIVQTWSSSSLPEGLTQLPIQDVSPVEKTRIAGTQRLTRQKSWVCRLWPQSAGSDVSTKPSVCKAVTWLKCQLPVTPELPWQRTPGLCMRDWIVSARGVISSVCMKTASTSSSHRNRFRRTCWQRRNSSSKDCSTIRRGSTDSVQCLRSTGNPGHVRRTSGHPIDVTRSTRSFVTWQTPLTLSSQRCRRQRMAWLPSRSLPRWPSHPACRLFCFGHPRNLESRSTGMPSGEYCCVSQQVVSINREF